MCVFVFRFIIYVYLATGIIEIVTSKNMKIVDVVNHVILD
jgi:hypothetical protein